MKTKITRKGLFKVDLQLRTQEVVGRVVESAKTLPKLWNLRQYKARKPQQRGFKCEFDVAKIWSNDRAEMSQRKNYKRRIGLDKE